MQSFDQWLTENGLRQYAAVFSDNKIDFDVVRSLRENDLRELGLALGDRKRLLQAVVGLNGQGMMAGGATAFAHDASAAAAELSGGERRQLTVMFCDLVGSTALSEKLDPEELRDLLHAYRTQCGEIIQRYQGFVARYVGDGILTYFGWPSAHEDDAERSIRAALDIVEAMPAVSSRERLAVRIGIATGPVVVGEQTGQGDQSKLAIGTTPNLAARLQGLAAADQIVVAAQTRRLVGNAFELADLGEYALKGMAEPARAWRVIKLGAAASRFEAATQGLVTPLVGREQEIGLLLDRWHLAQEGEGQVVLLSGEPGIGKSRILNTLKERLEIQGTNTLRFQCSPYYVNSTLYPAIDNLEHVLGFTHDEAIDSKLDKLENLFVTTHGRPLTDVRFVASMLSLPTGARYGPLPITPQKYKDETLRAMLDMIEAAARKQPTVMLFEDAHWADATSLEVLDLLCERIRRMPLLAVITHRPEFQAPWHGNGHITSLNLTKLTRAQSSAMVSKLTGGKLFPADLADRIIAKTDGVPLFVEELTKAILESGELKELADRYDYAGTSRSVTIPATLRDSLMARLDRFLPAKEIAQIGAAIGREFSYELIAAVSPMEAEALDAALDQLTESGLAFRHGYPPHATYTFKHALVQDAAYDSLLKSRRQALHTRLARVIEVRFPKVKETEPEVLAHHLTAAGEVEAAIPLWQKAGELALKRTALPETIAHLNRGLEALATLPASNEHGASELAIRCLLGQAWMAYKGWAAPEVWVSFHPALPLAKSLQRNDALLPILWGLWINVLCVGRAAEALDWVKQMLHTAEVTKDPDLILASHMAAADNYFWLGELEKSRQHADTVFALYDAKRHRHLADLLNHDPKTLMGVFAAHATWMLGYPDQAAQISDMKDDHARERNHPFDLGWTLTTGATMFLYRRETERLRQHIAEGERVAREHGVPFIWNVLAPCFYGMAAIQSGEAEAGIPLLQTGVSLWDQSGGKNYAYMKSVLAEGLALTGDVDGALRLIDEQIAQIEMPGWQEKSHYAEILRLKGWMLTLKDDDRAAEKYFLASIKWAQKQHAKSWELRTATSLAQLWQKQGKPEPARALLAPVYHWFTEGFDTRDLHDAKALLDTLNPVPAQVLRAQ